MLPQPLYPVGVPVTLRCGFTGGSSPPLARGAPRGARSPAAIFPTPRATIASGTGRASGSTSPQQDLATTARTAAPTSTADGPCGAHARNTGSDLTTNTTASSTGASTRPPLAAAQSREARYVRGPEGAAFAAEGSGKVLGGYGVAAAAEEAAQEIYLRVLRRTANAVLQIADGPMGRGLFTTSAVQAGTPLLSVPDVFTLAVPDPENAPPLFESGAKQTGQQHQPGDDEVGSMSYYDTAEQDDFLERWQVFHGLALPSGLRDLLTESDRLPAPVRLALFLLWLRRRCQLGPGSPAGRRAEEVGGGEDDGQGDTPARGPAFWRRYIASLPDPRDVTCPSVFSEREGNLLQVPEYLQQWRRTRDNLTWLLEVANRAAAYDDGCTNGTANGNGPSGDGSTGCAAIAGGDGSDGCCYSFEELCYCYAMATSRCFHLPGRMLFVPFADLGNHQPLWKAGAFPFWQEANGADVGSAGEGDAGIGGWFQFRAVRDLDPGTEVCICYSEGGNSEQLFSYGFVRQANPYDRLKLGASDPLPASAQVEDPQEANVRSIGSGQLPAGLGLCWPAVVAAAGFWADPNPGPGSDGSTRSGSGTGSPLPSPSFAGDKTASSDSAAAPDDPTVPEFAGDQNEPSVGAMEQSMLRPAGPAALHLALNPDPVVRQRLQRRRAALLSLPHSAAATAALRRAGLSWMTSPERELRTWAAAAAGAACAGRAEGGPLVLEREVMAAELHRVDALLQRAAAMAAAMPTSVEYDEALWVALTGDRTAQNDAAEESAPSPALTALLRGPDDVQQKSGPAGAVGWGLGVLRRFMGWPQEAPGIGTVAASTRTGQVPPGAGAGSRGAQVATTTAADALAEAGLYDTPRGRTALLARLEYKRVLTQLYDILASYRWAVESVLASLPR